MYRSERTTLVEYRNYVFDRIQTSDDISTIFRFIKKDGYAINELKIKFYYDHATCLAPVKFTSDSALIDYLDTMKKDGIELYDIEYINFYAIKGDLIITSYIYMHYYDRSSRSDDKSLFFYDIRKKI